jgi:hypothetical protein
MNDGSFIEEVKIERFILTRFMAGEDLFSRLERIARDQGIDRGVIISAIGSLKNVVFRNVKKNIDLPVSLENTHEIEEAGPLELLSLEGNFFPSDTETKPIFHLHAILGSPSGNLVGGHLLKATIFTTMEIVIGKITGSSVFKEKSELTGLMELLKK